MTVGVCNTPYNNYLEAPPSHVRATGSRLPAEQMTGTDCR